MRVLVAGASGFVGSRLCTALVDAGYEVRATFPADNASASRSVVPSCA